MKLHKAIVVLAFMIMAIPSHAQLTINIRYSGAKGAAKKYVKEMEQSGIASRIRAVEGCLRYDYFFSRPMTLTASCSLTNGPTRPLWTATTHRP